MKTTKDLFQLVQSLTKTETIYYKKYAAWHKHGTNYLKLFDAIKKQVRNNEYNEDWIRYEFKSEKFIINFPVAKSYLYKSILKALNSFYSFSSKENYFKECLKNIEILYRKALYKQCYKLLKSTKKELYRYDSFLLLLEIIKWEKNLIPTGICGGNVMEKLSKTYAEEQVIIKKINNLIQYKYLSDRVQDLAEKSSMVTDFISIKTLISHELLINDTAAQSYPEKIFYYHTKSTLYNLSGNTIKSYRYRRDIIHLMENNPEKMHENIPNYVISLLNLLMMCGSLKKYKELNINLNKLRNVCIKFKKNISEDIILITFIGPAIAELKMYLDTHDNKGGLAALENIQNGLKEYSGKIDKYREVLCRYYIANVYFQNGRLTESLEYLNYILNDKGNEKFSEIITSAKILNILIHYELNNITLLEYLIRSTYRYIKSTKNIDNSVKTIMDFFKKISIASSRKETIKFLRESIDQLKRIKKDEQGSLLLENFDFISYMELKIESIKS